MNSAPDARAVIDGVEYDYFGGTGYLGLQSDRRVIAALVDAAHTCGLHTATSRTRIVSPWIERVEARAAEFFGHEAGYYLGSGYVGPMVLAHLLCDDTHSVFIEHGLHYSGVDAARSTRLPVHRFAAPALEATLARQVGDEESALVFVDGVHASTGAIPPLAAYLDILERRSGASALVVDDAHGVGVLGGRGRGTVEHFGLWDRVNSSARDAKVRLFVTGTLSKALGGFGGILTGDTSFIGRCRAASHWFDGATPLPAPIAAATATALQLAAEHPLWRDRLRAHATRVRSALAQLGIVTHDDSTPILGFDLGSRDRNQKLHDDLRAAGCYVPYAESYAGLGPNGAMRLALFATHEDDAIDRLLDALTRCVVARP